jgi:hypothetical protein
MCLPTHLLVTASILPSMQAVWLLHALSLPSPCSELQLSFVALHHLELGDIIINVIMTLDPPPPIPNITTFWGLSIQVKWLNVVALDHNITITYVNFSKKSLDMPPNS